MLLSDRDIRAAVESGEIRLEPFEDAMVQPSSVDVRLDRYFRVFENHRYPHIDPAEEQSELTRMVEPSGEEPFILHPGEFVLGSTYEVVSLADDLAARLEGKALALGTPVPTPHGWRTMGDLRPGDEVFDETGAPTEVVAATPPMSGRACYELELSDGTVLVADAGHRWVTRSRADRRAGRPGSPRTTAEIADSLRCGHEFNHHVGLTRPVQHPHADLPIDPYVLGASVAEEASRAAPLALAPYLTAGITQRLALLQGLMDGAGHVDDRGGCEFVSTREYLADAVVLLAASLGLCPTKAKRRALVRGIDCGPAFHVRFLSRIPVFRLERKLARVRTDARAHAHRSVVAVRPVPSVAVRCIQVAAPGGQFLVGPTYVPTHNSSLGRLGLLTHSTAGFIDPGFSGHVTLELSNVATLPIKLWPGMKIGQLCFFRLSSPAEHPYGSDRYGSRYQGQRGPTASRSYLNFHRTQV